MATEYTFHGDADVGTTDLRAFVADVVGVPANPEAW
jgi:hypothetical protein